MADSDHLRQTLEHYRQLRQQKLDKVKEELAPIELMIRQLERDLGEAPDTEPTAQIVSATDTFAFSDSVTAGKTPNLRPDEFFTMTQSEAAKVYLRKVGHAVSFDELVGALRKGGAQLGGADPKKTLYVSLARNPMKEFVWPSEGYIGLSEFYGRSVKAMTPRQRAEKGSRTRRMRKVKSKNHSTPKAAAKAQSPDTQAMHELMRDGQQRTAAEIITALEGKLGRTPDRMAVVGSLNSRKRYEKQGDHYKAIVQE